MTADHWDLYAQAARLLLEHDGPPDEECEGFAVVYVHRGEAGEDPVVEITAVYGVRPAALAYLIEANDGWFGLEGQIPGGEIMEVLCHLISEPPTDSDRAGLVYLQIVKVDGKPAIEVYA